MEKWFDKSPLAVQEISEAECCPVAGITAAKVAEVGRLRKNKQSILRKQKGKQVMCVFHHLFFAGIV